MFSKFMTHSEYINTAGHNKKEKTIYFRNLILMSYIYS